jgi:hypothetical protein
LAVSPAVRFSLDGPRGPQLSNPCTLSASFAFLQSLAQHFLAGRPQSASSSRGLSCPYSTRGIGGPLPRGLPRPATFRPQGLVTLSAAYSLRAPAGFFSHRRRSWDFALRSFLLSAGIRRVSGRKGPRAVSPVGFPAAEAVGRPNGPRLLGFSPAGSPSRPTQDECVDRRLLPWASPLPGFDDDRLTEAFAPVPPSRFANRSLAAAARRRLGVSLSGRLVPPVDRQAGRMKQPS